MKSLVKTLNLNTMVFVLTIFLLISGTIFLGSRSMIFTSMEGQYRQMLSSINSVVRLLNQMDPVSPSEESLAGLSIPIDDLLVLWKTSDLGVDVDNRILDLQQRLLASEITMQEGISEIGDLARYLGNEFYTKIEDIQNQSLVIMFLILAVLLVVAFRLMFLGRSINDSYEWIRKNLKKLKEALSFSKDSQSVAPRWEEEAKLESIVSQSIEQVSKDRNLLEHTIHGTLDDVFPEIRKVIAADMPCDRMALAFIDNEDQVIAETAVVINHQIHLHQGYSEPIKNTSLGQIRDSGKPRIINDLEYHYQFVHQSLGSKLILDEGIRSSMTLPLVVQGICRGFIFISSKKKNAFTSDHMNTAKRVFMLLGGTIYHKYSNEQTIATTASGFVKLMEKKDNETSKHIFRMSQYSYILAKELFHTDHPDITHRMLREILLFAPLHDIGKIAIPDSILLKPGKLDNQEMEIMRDHVNQGQEVLERMNLDLENYTGNKILDSALNIIAAHHEKYDGTGYPQGLKGESIPIEGRIVAVADVLDALTSKRPYKEAWTLERSVEMIRTESGKHFDPWVVRALENTLEEIRNIYLKYREI